MGVGIYTRSELSSMAPVPAIVQPATYAVQIEAQIDAAHALVLEAEGNLEQRKIELGRLLCEYRKSYPERAKPGERSWKDYLEEKAIPQQRASESMDSYRSTLLPDSGISNEDDNSNSEPEPFHILVDAAKLKDGIRRLLKSWPDKARQHIPELLRDLAGELEVEC